MRKTGRMLFFVSVIALISRGAIFAEQPVSSLPPVFTLEECLKSALANSPGLRQALSTVNLNKAAVSDARSDYLPKATTTLGISHSEVSKVSLAAAASGISSLALSKKSTTSSEQTGIEQLLWDFGRTLNQVRLARENLTAAEYSFLEIQENILLNAKIAYFDALKAQLLAGVAKENLERAEAYLKQAKGFFEVGLKQKYDVTRAEVDVSNAKFEYVIAKKNYEIAKAVLNNSMGKIGNTNYTVEEVTEVPAIPEVNIDEALGVAMKNRAEILKLGAEVRAAERDIAVKKKGNWPQLSLSAGQGVSDTDVKGVGKVNSWNAGAALKWPWFDGFRTSAKVKHTEENLKIARARAEELTFDIALEVRSAVCGLAEARERIGLTEKTVQQAQENLEITEARYKEGLSSIIELDDARILMVSAKNNHIVSLSDYLTSLAKYERSLGTVREYAIRK
jgi:outer membrane protein TolC